MTVQFQFIRTTHENGCFRSFSPEALTFWQQHGSVVGAVLRPETPLTFAQILTSCREYAIDHLADGPQPELVPGYVAWVLVHLIHYGLAATVPAVPTPSIRKLNWTAVYPAAAEAAYAAAADQHPASHFPSRYGQNRH